MSYEDLSKKIFSFILVVGVLVLQQHVFNVANTYTINNSDAKYLVGGFYVCFLFGIIGGFFANKILSPGGLRFASNPEAGRLIRLLLWLMLLYAVFCIAGQAWPPLCISPFIEGQVMLMTDSAARFITLHILPLFCGAALNA